MTPLLSVRDLSVSFGRHRRQQVLTGVSFELESGQRLGLIGESGSGKSITALAIMGLLPDAATAHGSVLFNGVELLGRPDRMLARMRGDQLAMVFQEPMSALDPTMRVGRQVAEVVRLHQGAESGPARALVLQMLDAVGLPDPARVAQSYPHQLSGGMRQRVVLAMALINNPALVICDEATTALDVTVQARVLQVLDAALQQADAGCLFISHDLAVVAQVCTDVLVMLDGAIVDRGPIAKLFADPGHPYTAGLVATSRLDQLDPGQRLPTIADFYADSAERTTR